MPRFHYTSNGPVPFTKEEEAEFDRIQLEWEAQKPLRIQQEVIQKTQELLDNFARTRNYDNILSACTYAVSSVPKFKAEGTYCTIIRDQIWTKLYDILADVQNGLRPLPESFEEILPELPDLKWPDEY